MKRAFAAFLFVCLMLAAGVAHAQGVGTSGEVNGTIFDPSGGVVPKANVTAEEVAKALRFTAVSDNAGAYRFAAIPPGTYNVTAQISGFATEVQKGLIVTVGAVSIVDFHLKVATTAAQVEVTAEPPVVETERGSQSDTITQQYIDDLPIDRRDYLTFTLLVPGVSDSTRLTDDQDFRVKQTPQSGLSFYGSNGRGNSITVDGGETSGDSGGVRLTLSQDAVQEFQVNRSNYAADLGGAQGASVNIVSKSGTNSVHGTMYSYFRNDALDARDPFAFSQALQPGQPFALGDMNEQGSPIKDTLQRYQFGGSLGGPIRKDKTFFFGSFEGLRQDAQNSVPLLTNTNILGPTFDQQQAIQALVPQASVNCLSGPVGMAVAAQLPAPFTGMTTLPGPVCAGALTNALTLNSNIPLQGFLLNQFETQGGLKPYDTREYLASVRVDHRIDGSNQLALTYRFGHDLEQSPDVQSLTAYSAGSAIHNYDDNFQGTWFHQFNPVMQNELRVQWDYDSFNVIPNCGAPTQPGPCPGGPAGEVGLQIPGFINNLGTNIFLPNLTILRRYEFGDNLTWTHGNHTIKFGGDEILRGNHTESHTFFPGRFVFGTLPAGPLLTPQLPTLTSLESASFGLPQVYQQGFGDADYPAYTRPYTGLYIQDSWKVASNFTLNYGVRYEIDGEYNPLSTYYKDFGPRVSFAWDPFKDHKTVVRGGYGIFYGPIDAQIPGVDLSLGVLNRNRTTVENQHNGPVVPNQVLNVEGICGIDFPPGMAVPPFTGMPGASPCTRFISIYIDPINATPFSPFLQTAPQVFGELFGAGLIQCTTAPAGSAACITPTALGPTGINSGIFPTNSGPLGPLQVLFSNPPKYRPPYSQQASFGIEREVAPGFSVAVSGIYSHTLHLPVAIDTNLLPAPTTTVTLANGKNVSYRNWNGCIPGNPNSCPADPLGGAEFPGGLSGCANPFNCFVNPLIVQNNQYTDASSGLYEGLIVEVKKQFSNHFTMFGNYTFSKGFDTGTDFNSDYGPQDPTNLGLDRGLSEFDERHKVVVAGVVDSPWKNPILAGFELAPIFTYHSGLPFNLLAGGEVNGDNHTTNERPIGSPRDTGLGPDFYNFDMRLTWQHKLGEKVRLVLTAEGFNIANRTNFASVNNEVNPLYGINLSGTPAGVCPVAGQCPTGNTTFNVHGLRSGTVLPDGSVVTPSTPLAFTSAFPKRQIQLGARFVF